MKSKKSFFAKQLRKVMFEKNITQEELGNKIGINRQMISYWITSGKNPSLNSINKIAGALEMPVNYFIENSDSAEKENKNEDINLKIELINERNKTLEETIKRFETEISYLKDKVRFLESRTTAFKK